MRFTWYSFCVMYFICDFMLFFHVNFIRVCFNVRHMHLSSPSSNLCLLHSTHSLTVSLRLIVQRNRWMWRNWNQHRKNSSKFIKFINLILKLIIILLVENFHDERCNVCTLNRNFNTISFVIDCVHSVMLKLAEICRLLIKTHQKVHNFPLCDSFLVFNSLFLSLYDCDDVLYKLCLRSYRTVSSLQLFSETKFVHSLFQFWYTLFFSPKLCICSQSFSFVITIRTHGNISMHISFIRGLMRLPWYSSLTHKHTFTKPKGIEYEHVPRKHHYNIE